MSTNSHRPHEPHGSRVAAASTASADQEAPSAVAERSSTSQSGAARSGTPHSSAPQPSAQQCSPRQPSPQQSAAESDGERTRAGATTDGRPQPARMFPPGAGPSPDPAGSHHERRIRSFQPRRSRVTAGQRAALKRFWPQWGFDIDGLGRLDLSELFGDPQLPVVLEVGFGMGEATARMAADDPSTGILAVDVHTPGQGNLLRLADEQDLTNVRVGNGDAIILLREMIAPGALSGLRVYFPDPWPKARHHKRRLLQPEFLDLTAVALRSGAVVHCATDWEDYAEQMLEVLTAHPAYENTQPDGGFAPRPASRPLTRFEGQGLDKGHEVRDLVFRRI